MAVSSFAELFTLHRTTQVPPLVAPDEVGAAAIVSADQAFASSFWQAERKLTAAERRDVGEAVSIINRYYFAGGLMGGLLLNAKGLKGSLFRYAASRLVVRSVLGYTGFTLGGAFGLSRGFRRSEKELSPAGVDVLAHVRQRPLISRWARFYGDERNTREYWDTKLAEYRELAGRNLRAFASDAPSSEAATAPRTLDLSGSGQAALYELEQSLYGVYSPATADMVVGLVAQIELLEAVSADVARATDRATRPSLVALLLLRDTVLADNAYQGNPVWDFAHAHLRECTEELVVAAANIYESRTGRGQFQEFYQTVFPSDAQRHTVG
ncbi:uncharacterized protein V1510DRAFT_403264 [Dipodascopsis tothii]|uniref:uncharacterized protein n=1 Tax=Dipodascopsis tothii TaxID=44089 RepID=UPI0034CDB860